MLCWAADKFLLVQWCMLRACLVLSVPCTDELAYLLTPLVRGQFILPAERNQATMFLNTAPTLMSFLLVKVFFGGSGVTLGTAHGCMDLTKACCTGVSNS